jgi:aldehyde:ferredoxin oxidoreductase
MRNAAQYGYAGKVLLVDLSSGKSEVLATADYAPRFLGGRGLAARLFWELVPSKVGAFDPQNCLVCATGPVTGFSGLAGCRWVICGVAAAHQPPAFSYGNLGGRWGAALKYAGYDALVVRGKADRPVYLYIHDDRVETRDASGVWGLSTFDTIDHIHGAVGAATSVLTIGPAAENLVTFATALADAGASVSGGIGSIMGAKKLKAIAVAGNERPKAADPGRLKVISDLVKGVRASTFNAPSPWAVPGVTRPENCYGCGIGCSRQSYKAEKDRRYKSFCQATGVYSMPAMQFYGERNEVPMLATRLCDGYGLDSAVMAPLIGWLIDCFRQGLLDEVRSGLPLSRAGSAEFIEKLTRQISFREGFGDVLARGTLAAAVALGQKAQALTDKYIAAATNENRDYDPRLILTTALLFATEPRKPITQLHGISGNTLISWSSWARGEKGAFLSTDDLRTIAQRFWGGVLAADFSTYEGKALAAKKVQDRSCAQESLVLCDVHWPMQVTAADYPAGHVGDPAVESQILSAITGQETTAEELLLAGERIFNQQRAIQLRQGWAGRKGDRIMEYFFTEPLRKGDVFFNPDGIMPGPDGKLISRMGQVLERAQFEAMKDDYYRLRGWDVITGLPTRAGLQHLGLADLIPGLEKTESIV